MQTLSWRACGIVLAACLATLSGIPPAIEPATVSATSPSTWYWQNPLPSGYQLTAIACGSAANCIAARLDGSITATHDGGQHWADRKIGLTATFHALACSDPAVCYALGDRGPAISGPSRNDPYVLLRSTDGGATWQTASYFHVNKGQSVNSFSCASATTCLAGASKNYAQPQAASIFRTADSGKTWQSVHLAGIIGISTTLCATSTVCYAVGWGRAGSKLFRSDDSGKSWTGRGLKSPGWPPTLACPGAYTCFAAASTCDSGCWGIFLTTNGARSWKKVADGPAGHLPGAIACPSVTMCYVLATSDSNAYSTSVAGTTNGGKTWSLHHLPDSAVQITCPSQTACFLNANFSVLATQDGFGRTHEMLARSPLHDVSLTTVRCSGITTCYAASLRHACDQNGEECNQVAAPGAATADGGRTWTKTPTPPDLLARLSCPSAAVCYATAGQTGATGFVERSGDGTRTWHRVNPVGRPYGLLTDISCPSVTTCYVTASVAGPGVLLAVLVTRDAGKTWIERGGVDALAPGTAGTAPVMGRTLASVSCLSVTMCFVLAASVNPPPPGQNNAPQSRAKVAMLFTGDGGKTWTRKRVPDMNTGDSLGLFNPPFACPTPTTCYLLLSNGSTLLPSSTGDVLVTHNGGASWRRTVIQAGAILLDMACANADSCRVAGWSGIFATADGGMTWQKQRMVGGAPVPPLSSIACPDSDTCYAAGGPFFTNVSIVGTRAPGGMLSYSRAETAWGFKRPTPCPDRPTKRARPSEWCILVWSRTASRSLR